MSTPVDLRGSVRRVIGEGGEGLEMGESRKYVQGHGWVLRRSVPRPSTPLSLGGDEVEYRCLLNDGEEVVVRGWDGGKKGTIERVGVVGR